MIRCGAVTPEELIDLAIERNDSIVITDCPCCGRNFYALKSDLFIKNVINDNTESGFQLTESVKCPHCGYANSLSFSKK